MKNYVVGFMFDESKKNIILIRKNKPLWQKGMLNGVGGKIEIEETPLESMIREFKEETGVVYLSWDNFLTVQFNDCIVYFFKAFDNEAYSLADTTEEEKIEKLAINELIFDDVINNLQWIIPLALDEYVKKTEAIQ
jgi:8-oxo-dGTP diphosphatase